MTRKRIAIVGGGPAGLYFALLWKKRHSADEVIVFERNRMNDTFGFGVVFSDATLGNLEEADPESYRRITETFVHWDDIDTHFEGEVVRSTGHGFSGMSRMRLLEILASRCQDLGVDLRFQAEVKEVRSLMRDYDLVLGADGVNSFIRDQLKEELRPSIDLRPNRFVWLGTTFPFPAFTFYFVENDAGLWRVHAYRYEEGTSTFIVECTEETFEKSGLSVEDEDATIAYCEELFKKQLAGHRLLKNRSLWRRFPTVRCERWSYENLVLLGDAVHTAHFSIGSGTKLAMEDSMALVEALERHSNVRDALEAYEKERRPNVESLQRAAQVSLEWFENTERHLSFTPLQFTFSLLTRSLRVTHENLRLRDPELVKRVDEEFAREIAPPGTPPMFTPFRLRGMTLANRVVVSPMCQYSAEDGTIGDWHLVHLGSRAIGGAGLVMAEMTDVSREGRISPGCAGMYKPEHVAAWKRVVDFVHQNSAAKIGIQLGHAGRKGSTRRPWEGGADLPLPEGNWPLLSASPIPYRPESQVPREMTLEDMARVKAEFVRATELALEAGFDMIELHAAHGYLLASFISPLTNQRSDEYGGSIANRVRYPVEVFAAMRAVWPEDKPMAVRISACDWAPGGLTAEESVEVARAFARAGCDIIDVSTGQTVPHQRPVYGRLYQTPFAERIRIEAKIPTMTVGSITSYADVNSILAAGRADLCVLARAHLFDPYWTRHAAYEQAHRLRWPDPYASINEYNFRFK